MEGAHSVLPALVAQDDDVDDVRWALHTAQARWQAGGHADALVWMRRAADAAAEAGNGIRAAELREDAEDLAEQVWFSDKGPPNGNLATSPPDEDAPPSSAQVITSLAPASTDSGRPGASTSLGPGEFRSVRAAPLEDELSDEFLEADLADEELLSEPEGFDEPELIDDELELSEIPPAHPRGSGPPPQLSSQPPPRRTPPVPPRPPMFSESEVQRQSLTELSKGRRPMASAPDLEIEEVEFGDDSFPSDDLEALLAPPQEDATVISQGPFNDRLSSVDVESDSAEAAIAQVNSDPDALSLADSLAPSAASQAELSDSETEEEELADLISDDVEFEELDEGFAELAAAEALTSESEPGESARSGAPASLLQTLALDSVPPSAPASAQAAAPSASSEPEEENADPMVDGVALTDVKGLEDLPEDVQARLARSATVEELQRGDEVGFFGAALITRGAVDILPAIADDAGAQARQGDIVFTNGTLSDGIALRVEAKIDGTRVAVWPPEEIAAALASCPWVEDELRFIADYYLAVCGATLGPLGERLDNALRGTVFARMTVRACEPGQLIVDAGKPLDGLYVVGGGRVEVIHGEQVKQELSPGDLLFPATMLSAACAPDQARAGSTGALLLYASRSDARELMMSIPPLLEVLAS